MGVADSGIMPPMNTVRLSLRSFLLPVGHCYCSAVTGDGWRWIVDAHVGDGRHYIIHSDELLNAFLELEQIVL